jgi:DNA-binding NarL/FixJ family response regulator
VGRAGPDRGPKRRGLATTPPAARSPPGPHRPVAEALDDLARRARLDVGHARSTRGAAGPVPALTDREREVLRLLARGLSNREIGTELFITPKTASVHVSNILGKLGAASRTEAAAIAHREGL